MSDLIESYLTNLRARLARRLSHGVASELVQEIGDHLRESIADQVQNGIPVPQAQIIALRAVGNDRLVADGLIRAQSGINERSVWRFAWVSVLFLLLYGLIPLTFFHLEPVPEWLMAYTSWLPTCFVGTFAYACWRSRKTLLLPIAVTAAVLFVATMIEVVAFSPMGYTSLSKQARAHTIAGFQRNITDRENQLAFAKSNSPSKPFPAILRQGQNYLAPNPQVTESETYYEGMPVSIASGKTVIVFLTPFKTEREARSLWSQYGAQYAQSLEYSIRTAKSNQEFWRTTKLDAAELGKATCRSLGAFALIFGFIAILNLIVLGMSLIYRRMTAALWRPERLA